jgi:hypothetical protein
MFKQPKKTTVKEHPPIVTGQGDAARPNGVVAVSWEERPPFAASSRTITGGPLGRLLQQQRRPLGRLLQQQRQP